MCRVQGSPSSNHHISETATHIRKCTAVRLFNPVTHEDQKTILSGATIFSLLDAIVISPIFSSFLSTLLRTMPFHDGSQLQDELMEGYRKELDGSQSRKRTETPINYGVWFGHDLSSPLHVYAPRRVEVNDFIYRRLIHWRGE
jgi:hypothetical protein